MTRHRVRKQEAKRSIEKTEVWNRAMDRQGCRSQLLRGAPGPMSEGLMLGYTVVENLQEITISDQLF